MGKYQNTLYPNLSAHPSPNHHSAIRPLLFSTHVALVCRGTLMHCDMGMAWGDDDGNDVVQCGQRGKDATWAMEGR